MEYRLVESCGEEGVREGTMRGRRCRGLAIDCVACCGLHVARPKTTTVERVSTSQSTVFGMYSSWQRPYSVAAGLFPGGRRADGVDDFHWYFKRRPTCCALSMAKFGNRGLYLSLDFSSINILHLKINILHMPF